MCAPAPGGPPPPPPLSPSGAQFSPSSAPASHPASPCPPLPAPSPPVPSPARHHWAMDVEGLLWDCFTDPADAHAASRERVAAAACLRRHGALQECVVEVLARHLDCLPAPVTPWSKVYAILLGPFFYLCSDAASEPGDPDADADVDVDTGVDVEDSSSSSSLNGCECGSDAREPPARTPLSPHSEAARAPRSPRAPPPPPARPGLRRAVLRILQHMATFGHRDHNNLEVCCLLDLLGAHTADAAVATHCMQALAYLLHESPDSTANALHHMAGVPALTQAFWVHHRRVAEGPRGTGPEARGRAAARRARAATLRVLGALLQREAVQQHILSAQALSYGAVIPCLTACVGAPALRAWAQPRLRRLLLAPLPGLPRAAQYRRLQPLCAALGGLAGTPARPVMLAAAQCWREALALLWDAERAEEMAAAAGDAPAGAERPARLRRQSLQKALVLDGHCFVHLIAGADCLRDSGQCLGARQPPTSEGGRRGGGGLFGFAANKAGFGGLWGLGRGSLE